jgi:hypothetical protein
MDLFVRQGANPFTILVVSQGFAPQHGGQRRGFMSSFWWNGVLGKIGAIEAFFENP